VDEFVVDGESLPPLPTNQNRWQRVILDTPELFYVQGMDNRIGTFSLHADTTKKSFTLTSAGDPNWKATFTYEDPAPDQLFLEGVFNAHHFKVSMSRVDLSQFLLLNRGFHFINQTQLKR
jgi:hypothetical protein